MGIPCRVEDWFRLMPHLLWDEGETSRITS